LPHERLLGLVSGIEHDRMQLYEYYFILGDNQRREPNQGLQGGALFRQTSRQVGEGKENWMVCAAAGLPPQGTLRQ
jgi:hypothetical protein